LAIPIYLYAQEPVVAIRTEMSRLEALAGDPDAKLTVVAGMAELLHVHRNHLLLLRRETGQPFAAIYVSELRSQGMDDQAVLRNLQSLRRKVDSQLARESVAGKTEGKRPVLLVGSTVDQNSAGTVYSLRPEIGIDSSHVAAVIGVPYYRISNSSLSSGGVGDLYGSIFLRGQAVGFVFGSTLTVGAPTGSRDKGLGAGELTVDFAGTIAHRFRFAKPWISAGFSNSVFNNVGYQRAYVSDGNATHFGGGVDFPLPRKAIFGVTGFGLEPIGNQTVYSQTAVHAPPQTGGGMMPGSGGRMMPPFHSGAQQSVVTASELRDYGASVWLSIPLRAGFAVNAAVARSVPFHLTTVRVGLSIDVARLLFPGKRI